MTTLAKTLARIDALDDDFSWFSSQSKPPKKSAVDAVEKKLGIPLTPAHRQLMEALGALAVIVDEKVWRRPVLYETCPLWKHHWGFEVFGVASKAPLDVVKQTKARAPKGFVAAMARGGGSVVGYDKKGKLFEWKAREKPSVLEAKDLYAVIDEWLRQLPEDKAKLTTKAPGEEWLDKLTDDRTKAKAGAELAKQKPDVVDRVLALVEKKLADGEDDIPLFYGLGKAAKNERVRAALQGYALESKHDSSRSTAMSALSTQGLEAKHVVPTLLVCLAEKDLIGEAAYALQKYADPSLVKPLIAALAVVQKDKRWAFGVDAGYIYEALAAIAKKAKGKDVDTIIDVLTANLDPPERYAALPAFESLRELGSKAKRAVPALEKSVGSKDKYLSALARRTLGAITGDWAPHVEALQAAAKSKDSAVSSVAEEGVRMAKSKKR